MEAKLKHILNPVHVYCRLREMKIGKKVCAEIASFYETKFYKKVFERNKNGDRNS